MSAYLFALLEGWLGSGFEQMEMRRRSSRTPKMHMIWRFEPKAGDSKDKDKGKEIKTKSKAREGRNSEGPKQANQGEMAGKAGSLLLNIYVVKLILEVSSTNHVFFLWS